MDIKLILLAFGLIAGIIYKSIWYLVKRKHIETVFAGREQLSDEAFHNRYFVALGVSADVSVAVRGALSDVLRFDLSRITDTDDFETNLKFMIGKNSSRVASELLSALWDRYDLNLTLEEDIHLGTVRELVLAIDQAVKKNTGPPA